MPSPEAWFSWVCGLPWVTSFQEQSPGHCPRRKRAHHWYRYHGNASHEGYRLIPGTPHPKRLGGSGVRVLAGGGARAGWSVLSAVACSSSMPCTLPFVFPTLRWGACLSLTECHGRYGRSQLKASKLLCRSLLPGYRIPFFFSVLFLRSDLELHETQRNVLLLRPFNDAGFPLQVGFK